MSGQKKQVKLYSWEYFKLCAIGGLFSCGLTHALITPVDLVKCRKQVGIKTSFGQILRAEGASALVLGWSPTLIGYSLQGLCKFGFYEYFKRAYSVLAGEENAVKYKDLLFLSASASAEIIADVALCPWEAVKVKIQTADPSVQPRTFPTSLTKGLPQVIAEEGVSGLFKGLVPLWSRQVPYTMMKFWAFERTVEALYKHVVPKPRSECSKVEQLGVSFLGGYIAGVFCAVVSHPADSVVSKLNQYPTNPGIMHVAKELGPVGIWRGLGMRIFMIGTLTALQWFIYDSFKVAVGLPTTGAAQPSQEKSK